MYSHLDHFTLDLQCSWGRFQVETFVLVAFLQIWLWEHFKNYAPIPKVLSSYKTSMPSPQGLPPSWRWNKMVVSSNSFLSKVLNEEAKGDSLKEGTNFVVGEVNSSCYKLKAFITFLLYRHLF